MAAVVVVAGNIGNINHAGKEFKKKMRQYNG